MYGGESQALMENQKVGTAERKEKMKSTAYGITANLNKITVDTIPMHMKPSFAAHKPLSNPFDLKIALSTRSPMAAPITLLNNLLTGPTQLIKKKLGYLKLPWMI